MKACKMDRSLGSFIYKSQIFKSLSLMYHVRELPNSSESLLFSISVEIKEAEKKGRVHGVENNSNGKIISVIL